MEHYKFYQNKKCEYFPCHKCENTEDFNCLFCYCPLYALKDKCGGNFSYTENGIKDCSNCLRPHQREKCSGIQKQVMQVIEMVKKP